jgi:hypothetical protein
MSIISMSRSTQRALAKAKNISYEAPLRAKATLLMKKTGEVKEQEIYLGEFPLMTERGTFIINGVERVVVSSLFALRVSSLPWTTRRARSFLVPKLFRIVVLGSKSRLTGRCCFRSRLTVSVSSHHDSLKAFGCDEKRIRAEPLRDDRPGDTKYIETTF